MNLNRKITFFYTDEVERQTSTPIATEAADRGYEVSFSDNIHEKAEIGIYCQHECYPENSRFSVIMLHDLGQGHNRWPDIWKLEPWDRFDIAIIPGETWEDMWRQCLWRQYVMPRKGVYKLGWPKADLIFDKKDTFLAEAQTLRNNLGLKYDKSVLYAPSWENDGKQDDFVKSLYKLPVNLLLKQAAWPAAYPHILKNIENMNRLHENFAENVYIISPETNIMTCLALSDIIVSDESSVMIEALLLDVPSVAVMDWLIPDCTPSRFSSVPLDFPIKTTRRDLKNTIDKLLNNIEEHRLVLKEQKNRYFTHFGTSSKAIIDVIDSFVAGDKLVAALPVEAKFLMAHYIKRCFNAFVMPLANRVKNYRSTLAVIWKRRR